jgi:hypothetical protein
MTGAVTNQQKPLEKPIVVLTLAGYGLLTYL